MIAAPKSFSGTSGVMRFDRPVGEVMAAILDMSLEHHVAIVYGDVRGPLRALGEARGLPVVRTVVNEREGAMAEILRYGLIGAGMMGREHVRNLALVPNSRMAAISDPDERSRTETARAVGDGVKVSPTTARFSRAPRSMPSSSQVRTTPTAPSLKTCSRRRGRLRSSSRSRSAPPGRLRDLSRAARDPPGAGLGRDGVPLHAAGAGAHRRGARRRRRAASHARDPRAPLPVPAQGRRLEPLRAAHRRHARREVLPLLRPDAADRRRRGGAGLRLRSAWT